MRTEPQIIKAEKLSRAMTEAILYGPTTFVEKGGDPKFGGVVYCGVKTEKALIARGIMHPVNSDLTPKGIDIAKEIIADRAAVRAARLIDHIDQTAQSANDADREAWEAEQAACEQAANDAEQAAQWADVEAGEQFDAELLEITVTPEPIKYTASKFTARIVERDESAEFMATHPEPKGEPLVNLGSPLHPVPYESLSDLWKATAQRDKLARTIAYEYGHTFSDWSDGPVELERTATPRPLRNLMVGFYQDGSMHQPGDLIAEIENAMEEIMLYGARGSRVERKESVRSLTWLGWLIGYVMESGNERADGWQYRVRGPQDGWADMGLYSTEPSDETELPAWADIEDGDSFGCTAVISPQGRYNDAETCGDGISRAEYYANGGDSGMCEAHRLAEIVANDEPW